MAEIRCIRGEVALVDEEDLARCLPYRWRIVKVGRKINKQQTYVAAKINGVNNVYLHRFLMDAPKGSRVDHKNRDPLDCRRSTNLRWADKFQNAQNKSKHSQWKGKPTKSRYKGVVWDWRLRTWVARITNQGKVRHIGVFRDEISAAEAYDDCSFELHGAYGSRNFPDRIPTKTSGTLFTHRKIWRKPKIVNLSIP